MYVSGRVDIFDMVDIDLFNVVALNMMVLKLGYTCKSEPMYYNYLRPLTSLDEGLYALACEEDVCCMATLVKSFKLIEVYIEHGVTALDSYLRAPRFKATLEEITDESGSIAANRTKKILLLTCHESSETPKEPICDSITPRSLPQHDSSTPYKDSGVDTQSHVLPIIQSQFSDINLSFVSQQETASHVIDDVMRQLSFDETQLDGEAGFADVTGSGVDSSGHSRTHCAEVNTQEPIVAEVSTEVPIVEEVGTQEFSVEDVVLEDYVSFGEDVEQYNGEFDESSRNDGQFFFDDEGIDIEYDVQSSENAGTDDDDDDDVDRYFLVDEENEIVEPDVDVHLFGEDVDVINADGFDSDPGNDEETNYRKRRLAKLRTEMKGVINASGQWKRNLKLYKNDGVKIRARCDEKVFVFTMSQGTRPTGPNHGMEAGPSGSSGPTTRSKKRKNTGTNNDSQASSSVLDAHDKEDLCPWVLYVGKDKVTKNEWVNPHILVKAVQYQLQRELEVQISMIKAFRAKAKAKREIRGDHVLQYSMLKDYVVELQSTNPYTTVKIAVERNIDPSVPTRGPFSGQVLVAVGLDSNNGMYPLAYALVEAENKSSRCWFLQCLGDDIDLYPNLNFKFISDRQKGIIPTIKTVYPTASATNVRDFEKYMLELKMMNPKAHEWLNKIPAEHWARSYFSGRSKSDLLLNNIFEVFNGKIVGGRDKPVITLLEYIREYCMKRFLNVQGVIDKCTGPLTHTATRIIESIMKEAHLMKVQWNRANKYQVSGSLGDQCVVDVVSGSGVGAVIGLSVAAGEGGAGGPGGAGVASQGSSHSRWTKRRVQIERISPQKRTPTQPVSQPSTSS
ncbi:heat stress transcription factor B-4-like protein [Tanacetum coccineum]